MNGIFFLLFCFLLAIFLPLNLGSSLISLVSLAMSMLKNSSELIMNASVVSSLK